jgi:hypothetical protein
MLTNNQTNYENVLITKLVLNVKKRSGGKIIMNLPHFRTFFFNRFNRKKIRYVMPKGGVPILAGPAVIERFTAMAKSRKMSYFSI